MAQLLKSVCAFENTCSVGELFNFHRASPGFPASESVGSNRPSAACERAMCGLYRAMPAEPGEVLSSRGDAEFCVLRSPYRSTAKSLVAVEEPFKKTSSLYFPVGHPSGFEMWNSVLASPVGAIV
jgi:hypothetical protein